MEFFAISTHRCLCRLSARSTFPLKAASTAANRPNLYKNPLLPILKRSSKRFQVVVQASNSEDQALQLQKFAASPIFKYWIQGAVFLAVLAGVDAAFSGDWSRVGVISKDIEDGLKPLVVALGIFHVGCAVIAGRAAASKNIAVPPAVLKVLAVGFLAMVEVLLAEPEPGTKQ